MPSDGEELPILREVVRVHSHETRAMRLVIRDSAALAKVPLEQIPIDFDHEMMLVITLGRVPSDQYRVKIDRVVREGGELRVESSVVQPPEGAPLVPSSPYCIAVVPKCELNVAGFSSNPPARQRTWTQSEPGFGR
ncbi:MAG: protease complex subunit PrcB family protein [Phycisphaerae bacterium]|nr:protease complex subunit PrcB family protein [Phycisphaerae bacterium]